MYKKIIKNTSTVSAGNFVSLFLGFIRNILLAKFFGTSGILEAFIVAFRLPNLFRSVFGEGFADSVAVPVLSEYQHDKEKLFAAGNHLISLFIFVLFVFTLLGSFFSKYLVSAIVPGFIDQPDKFALAVSFTRITFFYLFFIGLSVNAGAILSAQKRFFIPAISPAFLNLSFIVGIPLFAAAFKSYILVICVLIGGVLQLILPFFSLARQGFSFKFDLAAPFKDKVITRMLKLFPPRVASSIIYHLSIIIDTIFSSLSRIVGEGALAAIWYANSLIHVPLSLVALPIVRVAIVDLSLYHSQGKLEDFKRLLLFSFQNMLFFIVPISVIYIFLAPGIIDTLFFRGDFDFHSLTITTSVFFFYSFGLFFFCAIKLLASSFYSLKDTLTPAKTTALCLVINVALSAILMFPLKIGGVALGSSLAAMVNAILLYRLLVKRVGKFDWADTKSQCIRLIALSLFIAILSRHLWDSLTFHKYLKSFIIVGIDSLLFAGGGLLLGIKQIVYLKTRLFKNHPTA